MARRSRRASGRNPRTLPPARGSDDRSSPSRLSCFTSPAQGEVTTSRNHYFGNAMPASQHQNPKTDIEIAEAAKKRPIMDISREKLGIAPENLEPYGHYK